jgi:hypothetical protein
MPSINQFAALYKLRLRRDPDDATEIIPGRIGRSHVFEYGAGLLGALIMRKHPTAHYWNNAKRAFRAVGMAITQNAECEGCATFDPNNAEQVRVALKYATVKRKRQPSPAQLASLAKGVRTRFISQARGRISTIELEVGVWVAK